MKVFQGDGENHRFMGWLPDRPDIRDFTVGTKTVPQKFLRLIQKESPHDMLLKTGVVDGARKKLPPSMDLREWCPPVEDQGDLGACTAHAGIGLVEYYERKAYGRHIDASRLFLYKATRNLMRQKGDTGAYLRTTMEAMTLFGVPPEEYWPYDIDSYDREPTAFCYAFAQNYQTLKYIRLDPPLLAKDQVLEQIKSNLAAKIPAMFGFSVYDSISQAETGGLIPFPSKGEKVLGGHAVMAVGYDDKIKIENRNAKKSATSGALLMRNSWGSGWGEKGYGWLPYEYVLKGLAIDWWTALKNEWIDTGEFTLDE
jgi:C1A family cysteine protease